MHPPGPDFTGDQRPEQFAGIGKFALQLSAFAAIALAFTGVIPGWTLLLILPVWFVVNRAVVTEKDSSGPVEGLLLFNRDPDEHERDDRRR